MRRFSSADRGPDLARLAPIIGAVVAFAGVAVLVGWAFDIQTLKSGLPGLVTMKPNAALGFVLAGASLWLSSSRDGMGTSRGKALAAGCAILLAAIGVLTLAEYAFQWDLQIDELLFHDARASLGIVAPDRMAAMAAINFTLLAAALLVIDVDSRAGTRPSNWLALVVCADSYLAILGYVYGVSALYAVVAMSTVALHTAVLFVLVGVGVACARPDSRFGRQMLGDNMGGQVNRRLLPVAIVIPPLLGWLSLKGELAGFYPAQFGLAIFTIGNLVIISALVWRSSRVLQQIHDQRIAVTQVSAWQRAILDSADLTVIATDVDGGIRSINAGAQKKLGYAADELIGTKPLLLHDPEEVAARAKSLSEELGEDVPAGFEVFVAMARRGVSEERDWTYVCKDGSTFPVRLSVTPLRNATGELTGFLGIGTDITQRKQAETQLLRLARFDSLTGLANRSRLLEILNETMARSERDGDVLALIFLDLDHFKQINDTFGHHVGDQVLKEFAARLSNAVRASDTVARLAGDEFVVVLDRLHQPGDAQAEEVAGKIAASMCAPFRILGREHAVSASMGIALRRSRETDPEALLRRADVALYQAKHSGRGVYSTESS